MVGVIGTAPRGVLVVDKPGGMTSHDVVHQLRKKLKTREIGHSGTLDPMATGVLVVCIGEGTKLVPYLTAAEKGYDATIALGTGTATLDAEGEVTETKEVPTDWQDGLKTSIDLERARTSQVPPSFSAIRVDGVRSHVLARRGEAVEHAPREVRVASLEVRARSADPPTLQLSLEVSKGYYVRSLARDLATSLGTVGHLTALRRTRSGCFSLADACSLADEKIGERILTLEVAAARALPVAYLTAKGRIDAFEGRPIAPEDLSNPTASGPCAWLDETGTLVAIGEIEPSGRGQVLRGFR